MKLECERIIAPARILAKLSAVDFRVSLPPIAFFAGSLFLAFSSNPADADAESIGHRRIAGRNAQFQKKIDIGCWRRCQCHGAERTPALERCTAAVESRNAGTSAFPLGSETQSEGMR